jgi:hypothetical protein
MTAHPLSFRPCMQMLLLLQTDVTRRTQMENRVSKLTETQLNMLEQVGGSGRLVAW